MKYLIFFLISFQTYLFYGFYIDYEKIGKKKIVLLIFSNYLLKYFEEHFLHNGYSLYEQFNFTIDGSKSEFPKYFSIELTPFDEYFNFTFQKISNNLTNLIGVYNQDKDGPIKKSNLDLEQVETKKNFIFFKCFKYSEILLGI